MKKRSSIVTKLVLLLLTGALIFALAACGPKENPKPPAENPKPPEEETAFVDQVADVLGAVGPILNTVKNIDADKNIAADASIVVAYDAGDNNKDTYTLSVKGNLNKTAPEAEIELKNEKTTFLNLRYKDKVVFLEQALTAINTGKKTDTLSCDVGAIEPAIKDLMHVAMESLEKLAGKAADMDVAGLQENVKDLLGGVDLTAFEQYLAIKEIPNGNRLSVTNELLGMVIPMVSGAIPDGLKGIVDDVVNGLFGTEGGLKGPFPTINVDVIRKEAAKDSQVKEIKISFEETPDVNTHSGSLTIDLNRFDVTDKAEERLVADIPADKNVLTLGASASLPRKGIDAEANVYLNPDLSETGKLIGYGSLAFNGQTEKSQVVFDGRTAKFDIGPVYDALNSGNNVNLITKPDNNVYMARIPGGHIVELINDAAKGFRDKFDTPPAESSEGDKGTADDKPADETASPSILAQLYEQLLGGDLDGITGDPTPKQMLAQAQKRFGEYLRFDISKKTDGKTDADSYQDAIDQVTTLWKNNSEWIIGTKEDHEDGKYGIFTWNKENWTGGVQLVKEGEKNDLLDAANVFFCWGKDADNKPVDLDTGNISEGLNYYIAHLYKYIGDDEDIITGIYEAESARDEAEAAYYAIMNDPAKTAEEKEAAETAWDAAQQTYKGAVSEYYNNANASKVIKELIGGKYETDNYLKEILDGGFYVGIGCEKGEGLNGSITVQNGPEAETVYGKVGLNFGVTTFDFTEGNTFNDNNAYAEGRDLAISGEGGALTDIQGAILGELEKLGQAYLKWQPKPAA